MTTQTRQPGRLLHRWRSVLFDMAICCLALYGATRLQLDFTVTSVLVAAAVVVMAATVIIGRYVRPHRRHDPLRALPAGTSPARPVDWVEDGPVLGRKSALMVILTSGLVIAKVSGDARNAKPAIVAAPQPALVPAETPTAEPAPGTTIRVLAGDNLKSALEGAPANSKVTLQQGATFNINAPIVITARRVIIDAQGATLRIGTAPTGETSNLDLMLLLKGTDQRIENAVFGPRKGGGKNSTEAASVNVQLEGGTHNEVRSCTFNTGSLGAIRVWSGNEHRIVGNTVNGSAIGYSHNGSSRTHVAGNTILNAPQNALSGTGNGTAGVTYNDDCMIVDNTITNPGRMGIEDIAQTRRTIIRGNHITNSADIAISAVGIGPLVQGNAITFTRRPSSGIEATSDGGTISNNTVTYLTSAGYTGAGVSINGCNFIVPTGVTVTGNLIHSSHYGIGLIADVSTATISNNTITNPVQQALGLDPASADAIVCSGNQIRFSVPSDRGNRDGITVGNCPAVTLTGNTITYTQESGGGNAHERPIRLMANNTVLNGNSINGDGRMDGHLPVSSGGAAPSGLVITANQFRSGATLDVTNMVSPMVANNGGYP